MGKLIATALCLVFLFAAPSSAEQDSVGLVKVLTGRVDAVRDDTSRRLALGASVFQGDSIRTSSFGTIGVTFQDGTMLSMGSDGEITIDEFVYDPGADELSFATRMSAGVMTFTTGVIGKLRPEAVSITTPLATMGIRGTRFIVALEKP